MKCNKIPISQECKVLTIINMFILLLTLHLKQDTWPNLLHDTPEKIITICSHNVEYITNNTCLKSNLQYVHIMLNILQIIHVLKAIKRKLLNQMSL